MTRTAAGAAPPQSDVQRALHMFAALGLGQSEELHVTVIPGAPWSKSRPRFARGRTYTAKDDVDAEQRTALFLRRMRKQPMTGNVALGAIFFRPNRQRIDADNLLKHVCDAANGVLWFDDSQCTAIMGVVEMDAANPRTVVVVGEHRSSLLRGVNATKPCAVCGTPVAIYGVNGSMRKTCSRTCSMRMRGYESLEEPIPCQHCGSNFRRRTNAQKMCSPDCRKAALRATKKSLRRQLSSCSTCGRELTHNRGGRCRDCWRAAPKGELK